MSTVDVLTAHGAVVRIRPVTVADADLLLALHERASERSRYLRFSSGAPSLPGEVDRLVRAVDGKHLALLAEDGGLAIGVASYEVTDADRAEFAVLVDDARQGEGVGTLLLEQLAAEARRHGIAELVGEVLPTNAKMLKVSRDLAPGTARSVDYEYGVTHGRVPTTPDAAALAAVCARDRTAAHHSLRPLLAGGFTGPVYPVNPHAERIAGLAETGGEGAATQAEIVRLARAHGLRLVGPNCLPASTAASSTSRPAA